MQKNKSVPYFLILVIDFLPISYLIHGAMCQHGIRTAIIAGRLTSLDFNCSLLMAVSR